MKFVAIPKYKQKQDFKERLKEQMKKLGIEDDHAKCILNLINLELEGQIFNKSFAEDYKNVINQSIKLK